MRNYVENKYVLDMTCPCVSLNEVPEMLEVSDSSPRTHRCAVDVISRFFRSETGETVYFGDGPELYNDGPECRAFLWPLPEAIGQTKVRVPCVGAAVFRRRKRGWRMEWIWIHPYFRRGQIIQTAWPKFEAMFPGFEPEKPYSPPMLGFLAKLNKQRSDGSAEHDSSR